jgi:hypothetical protein
VGDCALRSRWAASSPQSLLFDDLPIDPKSLRSLSPIFRPEAQLFFETSRNLGVDGLQMTIWALALAN